MLKASIVYLPGSGGTFLYRTLNLSERTVPGDSPYELNYTRTVDAKTRLNNYSNWTSNNWKQGEIQWATGYKSGLADFVDFEIIPNWVIDHWHPSEFLPHDTDSIAWEQGAWPWLIFICVGQEHKEFLIKNQSTKQYHLDWDKEISALNILKTRYANRVLEIDFDAFFDKHAYVQAIKSIDQTLDLNLNFDHVEQLWHVWHTESQKVWQ